MTPRIDSALISIVLEDAEWQTAVGENSSLIRTVWPELGAMNPDRSDGAKGELAFD